jgi:hypothetical protein
MEKGVAIDFYQFWNIAGAPEILPGESVYTLATGEKLAQILFERSAAAESPAQRDAARFRVHRIDAVSTPFFYACFRALRTGDYDTDLRRHRLGSLVVFVLALLLIARFAGCRPATALAALAFFLWAFQPLRLDLVEGNVNAVQLAVIALVFWLRRDPECAWRTITAACLLALAVLFKPNIIMIAVLLLFGWGILRRWHDIVLAAIGTAVGSAVAIAASAWLMGTNASWGAWLEGLRRLESDFAVGVEQGNIGGAKLIGDAMGWNPTVPLLILLVGGTAGMLWHLRRARNRTPASPELVRNVDALMIALGPAVAILGTTMAWPHYTVLCVPLCLMCLNRLEAEARLVSLPGLIVLAALIGLSSAAWLNAVGVHGLLVQAIVLALGVVALYAGGLEALNLQVRATEGGD